MATETIANDVESMAAEDVGNIVLLEHVNVQSSDQQLATLFYLVGMGFTRDPHMMVGLENMWVNYGRTQVHLPSRGNPPNVPLDIITMTSPERADSSR